MTKEAKAPKNVVRMPSDLNGPAMRMALWPAELWLQWQSDMLKAAAPVAAKWMSRRREGAEAALQAVHRLCACESANDVARVQNEWMAEEAKRLESDFRSLASANPWVAKADQGTNHEAAA